MITRSEGTGHRASASLRVLLTGGRAPVTLDLARMLHRAGHQVYVAESAARHLTRSSGAVEQCAVVPSPRHDTCAYLAELERLVQDWQIDLLIPMCEEVFYVAQGAERLRTYCHVLVTTLEQLHKLHHKYNFIQLAESLGLSVPDTRLINNKQEWIETQSVLQTVGNWVWKPVYSRFAAKVRMPRLMTYDTGAGNDQQWDVSHKNQRHFRNDPPEHGQLSFASPWVAQAYIPGQMLCTYSIAHEGQLVAHATYDSRYRTGSAGASVFFEQVEHEGALAWVRQFVEATGFSGQIGFDFIEGQDRRVYAIECNPRATSGIHLFHSGEDLVRALTEPETLIKERKMITPSSASKAMLMLPMLGSGVKQILGKGKLRAWIAAWRGARDVVYMRQDIQPIFEQFGVVLAAWHLARSQKISLTEALTHDIEWNGEQQ